MVRNKMISLGMVALLSVNCLWDFSPVFYNSMVADAKTRTQIEEEMEEVEVISKADQVDALNYGLCEKTKDGSMLHAFCWSFNTIKESMEDIANAGYTTVQTSPVNACNNSHPQMKLWSDDNGTGGCWWWHYQPIDWIIGNYQLGTREEYIAMCDEAEKYGVKIISDVLPNHTSPDLSLVSDNLANAAGGKTAGNLYHSNGFNEIQNYSNKNFEDIKHIDENGIEY